MAQTTEPFELEIEVKPEDIDWLGHVNNIVYLRWVQDAAVVHWQRIAPPENQRTLLWVIRRHEIGYKRPAMPGDTVIARTWVEEASRFAFNRHTEILRSPDRTVLAVARTVLCPLDRKTGRPTDVSPEIRALFSSSS
ncbi:thioesterase [Prosthecochloris sp. GSB1]|uniref:acyl-CoA thioesterase n=1 Tax=Prosthecochloris sp. GSB1 TaxID=281093 RepID=UPI000B8CFB49|nr:thioesterase family protein [Prosthecochloris sp. GSB1]ASQ90695.1 thioesterase [Prosthecochloris sp. GSB1]